MQFDALKENSARMHWSLTRRRQAKRFGHFAALELNKGSLDQNPIAVYWAYEQPATHLLQLRPRKKRL